MVEGDGTDGGRTRAEPAPAPSTSEREGCGWQDGGLRPPRASTGRGRPAVRPSSGAAAPPLVVFKVGEYDRGAEQAPQGGAVMDVRTISHILSLLSLTQTI